MKFRLGGDRTARSFAEERGSVAIMAALVALPLALLSFAAVEFFRYTAFRSDFQDALDAATLAVARSTETDPVKLQAYGHKVLLNGFGEGRTGFTLSNVQFNDENGDVTSRATLSIQPIVASLLGAQSLSATAGAKASRLGERLEVTLVLDNTYSMLTNSRLDFTQKAAVKFVETLSAAAARTHVADALKISLVPYSDTVRLAPADRGAWWVDRAAASPIHDDIFNVGGANRFTLLQRMNVAWAGCLESREAPYDISETGPSTSDPRTLYVPYFAPDEPDLSWNSSYAYRNDYLPDDNTGTWFPRQQNITKYNQAPTNTSAVVSGYVRGPNFGCSLQPMVRLTTNTSAVIDGIKAMQAVGDTYTNMGLMWGWHTLSPIGPFADGAAYGPGVRKIAVVMTDGENTIWTSVSNPSPNDSLYSNGGYIGQNRFGITSGSKEQRRAALDARMTAVCNAMKAKEIVIYTIRVQVTDTAGGPLRDCATSPEKFYDVTDPAQLETTFKTIADSLLNLRIAG